MAMTTNPSNFLERLQKVVDTNSDRTFAFWYDEKGKLTDQRTFQQAWDEAGLVAYHLRHTWKLQNGDKVVLCYDFGLHFFSVFLACLRAGITAVLVYPPSPPLSKSLPVLNKIVDDCQPKLVLTCRSISRYRLLDSKASVISKTRKLWPKVGFQVTQDLVRVAPATIEKFLRSSVEPMQADHVPFLQYTSGSTGEPKGVIVKVSSLQANLQVLLSGFQGSFEQDGGIPDNMTGCLWLPMYHDLGLLLTILPFVQGWTMHNFSPLSFIRNPTLWMDLLSRSQAHWSAAPAFAMRLVARKFQEQQRRSNTPPGSLDLSALRKIQVCAEPVPAGTKQLFEQVFQSYGLREDWFKVGYGLAEHVVGVGWIVGEHSPVVNGQQLSTVVAVASRETLHSSVCVKIVDPTTRRELPDGQVGELWLSGPSVVGGYLSKPELSTLTFEAALLLDGAKGCDSNSIVDDNRETKWLRTGDLGFFDDRAHLFISGRIKDLIIVNGKNYFPQDIEAVVQAADPAIRAGCVAAFSSTETADDLEIVFEIRQAEEGHASMVAAMVQRAVATACGLVPSRVVAIQQKSIPKTTSGKIKRRATRSNLQENNLPVVFETRDSRSQPQSTIIPEDLPYNELPPFVLDAVNSITMDHNLLESYFRKLSLDGLAGVVEAWNATNKSQEALIELCQSSLGAMKENYPSLIQFLNLLVRNPQWIEGTDYKGMLSRLAHCMFVMNFAVGHLTPDSPDEHCLLAQKIRLDDEHEGFLTQELGLAEVDLPEEVSFLADGNTADAAYGALDTFPWLKQRSVRQYAKFLTERDAANPYTYDDGNFHLGMFNILQAMWLDQQRGFANNAATANWLAIRSGHKVESDTNKFWSDRQEWTRLYAQWNMAFGTTLRSPGQEWLCAKHFIPIIMASKPEDYFKHRITALYLIAQIAFMSELRGDSRCDSWLVLEASNAFGTLNRRHAFNLEHDNAIDWEDPLFEENPNPTFSNWLAKFDEMGGRNQSCSGDLDFGGIMEHVFGSCPEPTAQWTDIGLSSMTSVQLRDLLVKSYPTTLLPPDCFHLYPTPAALRDFVMNSKGQLIPTEAKKLLHLSPAIPWLLAGWLQGIGIVILLLLFAISLVAPIYIEGLLKDAYLPLGVSWPCFIPIWTTSFSLIVVFTKWIIVGRYQECQLATPSFLYLRWWFVDRLVHLWEFWVGQFIVDTPLIWLVYRLLGARIEASAEIKQFIREFDLVEIEAGSTITSQLRCRKFCPWKEGCEGPDMIFRPIRVGKKCSVGGFISPGTTIGDFTSIERSCVLKTGSVVPSGIRAAGNPPLNVGPLKKVQSNWGWQFGMFKIIWLFAELYMSLGLVHVGRMVLGPLSDRSFRYQPLVFGASLVSLVVVLSVLVSIPLKWILIGRRKPGHFQPSLLQECRDWAADYHYRIASSVLFCEHSKLWNLLLKAMGMDIDLASIVDQTCIYPSNMDLLTIKRSMFTQVTFETEKDDACYHRVELHDATVGYLSTVVHGVRVSGMIVPPFSSVSASMSGTPQDGESDSVISRGYILGLEVQSVLYYLVHLCSVVVALIPSYEVMKLALEGSTATAIPAFGLAWLLFTVVSFAFLHAMSLLAVGTKPFTTRKPSPLYRVYHTANFLVQSFSMQSLLWGTPFYPMILRALGATVEGRLLWFGFRFYEPTMLRFRDLSCVDDSNISGHNVMYHRARIGPVLVGGLLTKVFAMADSVAVEERTGPCCSLAPTSKRSHTGTSSSGDIETGLVHEEDPDCVTAAFSLSEL